MVLLIPDMKWLNLALEYSGMPNFSIQYMCTSEALIFYDKRDVHLSLMFTPQDGIMRKTMIFSI